VVFLEIGSPINLTQVLCVNTLAERLSARQYPDGSRIPIPVQEPYFCENDTEFLPELGWEILDWRPGVEESEVYTGSWSDSDSDVPGDRDEIHAHSDDEEDADSSDSERYAGTYNEDYAQR
jgi:hypothetical protein